MNIYKLFLLILRVLNNSDPYFCQVLSLATEEKTSSKARQEKPVEFVAKVQQSHAKQRSHAHISSLKKSFAQRVHESKSRINAHLWH